MTADEIRGFRNVVPAEQEPFSFVMLREIAAQLAEIRELLKKSDNRAQFEAML